ncbi:sigma-54-dependent transcriptional regulator [Aquirhabdus parva]|uniref:Sigma-54-dependent Fis family transcriptional regulator n=1 Tax=Aquirhabdus parva TaxID=2283318 RepID=A0A345PA75_9GAMM|nr:sigma-54 dependent transcriptional regulator [Aquirhabdus parva]AXI04184.1 sigma-54-dependent Fis family transcriptional regulator [Aquirhabdus parva]
MTRPIALIVDDEEDLLTLMRLTLLRMGVDAETASTLKDAQRLLKKQSFDFCLTDLNLPDGSGLSLVSDVARDYPNMPIAVITAYGSMDVAIDALKKGAFDFVSKPVELARLRVLVERALQVNAPSAAANEEAQLSESLLIGKAPVMLALRTTLTKLARSQAPVYISGESGTGKEVVARLIHLLSPRSSGPFIPVNCGAIPAELMESEFFGHKKGSFTGATEDKLGLFQSANGGTLFLDEVADLPLAMQVKLLRAIQEKKVRPIGTQTEVSVDIRLLSATHKNLQAQVNAGGFRQDLFYRINVIEVQVPPLRDRGDDILLLADTFLQRLCADWGITPPKISKAAQQQLLTYAFPGNVRELQNTLERALTLCDDGMILPEHLKLNAAYQLADTGRVSDVSDSYISNLSSLSQVSTGNAVYGSVPAAAISAIPSLKNLPPEGLEVYLQDIERHIIQQALDASLWNRTAAAKKLGMSFRSLRYRLKKLGLGTDLDKDDIDDEEIQSA